MKDYIKIQNLVIDYGESLAVDKINIDIEKGSLVTLLGPSGCGKSTTLNALAGLITPTSGKILFNDKDVTRTAPSNRGIGLVFQSYALYPHMSVYDNIAFALKSSKEFKAEIVEFNNSIQYEIYRTKWKALNEDLKEFERNLNIVEEFKRLSKERNDLMVQTNITFKAKVSRANELVPNEKLKMDGKIKSASDSILKKMDEWEEEIKRLKAKANVAKNKLSSKEQIDSVKAEVEIQIKNIIETKEAELLKYESNIKRYKEDYKNNSVELKKLKAEKIKEANEYRVSSFESIKETHTSKFNEIKPQYPKAFATLKNVASKYKKGQNESADIEIDRLTKQLKTVTTEIDVRVKNVADKVGITQNLQKMVTNLSGGQQQRVAISRTLVKNPDILLLDEPLSNLDAKMRITTREWIRELQQDLGITTIFVTHDQEEAMSISDEIVCMSVGHVQQKAAPMDMYHQPANKFVAGFLGMPMMNFFTEGKLAEELSKITKLDLKKASFGCRPEHIKLFKDLKTNEKALLKLKGEVVISEAFGREVLVTMNIEGEIIRFFAENEDLKRGDKIEVALKKGKVYAFERKGQEKTIGRF